MNFFRSCRYNTGLIKKTKNGLEHIFETCIFKRMKLCLREKKLRVLVMSIFLFSLIVLVAQIFEMMLVVWLCSIDLLVR